MTETPAADPSASLEEIRDAARDLMRTAQNASLAVQEPRLLGSYVPGWHSWPDVEGMCEKAVSLVAAIEAVLDLAAEWEAKAGTLRGLDDCADELREAISRELTGKGAQSEASTEEERCP